MRDSIAARRLSRPPGGLGADPPRWWCVLTSTESVCWESVSSLPRSRQRPILIERCSITVMKSRTRRTLAASHRPRTRPRPPLSATPPDRWNGWLTHASGTVRAAPVRSPDVADREAERIRPVTFTPRLEIVVKIMAHGTWWNITPLKLQLVRPVVYRSDDGIGNQVRPIDQVLVVDRALHLLPERHERTALIRPFPVHSV
jgi:hypothetical protein